MRTELNRLISQVKDENERRYAANEWTDADKEKFKRLMSDHR